MILLQLAANLSLHYSVRKCNAVRVVLQVTNRFRTILYNLQAHVTYFFYIFKIYSPNLYAFLHFI